MRAAGSVSQMSVTEGTNEPTGSPASYAGSGPFRLDRIHLSEALIGVSGILMLGALPFASAEQDSIFGAISVLGILVGVIGAASLALPVVVAISSRTDLPIAWETLLSGAASLLTLVLLAVFAASLAGGLREGFLVVLSGSVLCTAAGWRSVAREY